MEERNKEKLIEVLRYRLPRRYLLYRELLYTFPRDWHVAKNIDMITKGRNNSRIYDGMLTIHTA